MVGFEKYHGTGNDFIVVDADEDVAQRRRFARTYCDRETGITQPNESRTGADGVLFLALEDEFDPPRVVMTLVNPDGTIAAMCGNGARVAAQWAAERTGADEVMIDTPAGSRHADVRSDGVTIEMGTPRFDPSEVPVDSPDPLVEEEVAGVTVTAVNTGVPQAVAFVDDVSDVDMANLGPEVRHADVFPEGANFTVASRRTDGGFDQRTYERGVEAETESCGTGAVAVGAVAEHLGKIDPGEEVGVHPPGGRLGVTVEEDGATLDGPVEREFGGQVPEQVPSSIDAAGD
jgi:diaminopimelate epimerase